MNLSKYVMNTNQQLVQRVRLMPLGFLLALGWSDLQASDVRKPNFVLIVADDLGYGDLGCYGSTANKTPHIDALAASGMRFTDFHSAGCMCSPTRAAMLTGQYQQRFNIEGPFGESPQQRGLPHEAITIAELLKTQGYATACFGKWHLGIQPPWLPTSQGFDVFRGLATGDGDFHTRVSRSGNEDWWHDNQREPAEGYTTDLLTRYSVEFIEAHREQPFFLYVPHLAIHFPWQGPGDPAHRKKGRNYDDDKFGVIPEPGNVSPHVKAMIEALDKSVGEIISSLKKWQLEQHTLVVFTSDNGGYLTVENFRNISSNGALRGAKGELYEGGHRVPAVMSWPGKISPAVTAATAHSIDLLPTVVTLTGFRDDALRVDGIDLAPLLFSGQALSDRMLYWRAFPQSAVRSGPWKLYKSDEGTELYNLDDDIGEKRNLASDKPDLVEKLSAAWSQWEIDVNKSASQLDH